MPNFRANHSFGDMTVLQIREFFASFKDWSCLKVVEYRE